MTVSAIKAIHTGFRAMGIIEEDDKRAFYMRVVSKSSLRVMSEQEHQRVIEEQRRQGFKPTSKGRRKRLEGKYAAKMQALWIAGYNLGVVTNGTDEALIAFVKRQTGLDHVRFLHDDQDAYKAIESLKKWLERSAGVAWNMDSFMPAYSRLDGYKIAAAQWIILHPDAGLSLVGFADEIRQITGVSTMHDMNRTLWITVMNEFGERIRSAKP